MHFPLDFGLFSLPQLLPARGPPCALCGLCPRPLGSIPLSGRLGSQDLSLGSGVPLRARARPPPRCPGPKPRTHCSCFYLRAYLCSISSLPSPLQNSLSRVVSLPQSHFSSPPPIRGPGALSWVCSSSPAFLRPPAARPPKPPGGPRPHAQLCLPRASSGFCCPLRVNRPSAPGGLSSPAEPARQSRAGPTLRGSPRESWEPGRRASRCLGATRPLPSTCCEAPEQPAKPAGTQLPNHVPGSVLLLSFGFLMPL